MKRLPRRLRRYIWIIKQSIKDPLWRLAHGGHSIAGKYVTYGEGAVHHNGHPCEHGLNLDRHPLIFRTDYTSYWHWLRTELSQWCFYMDLQTRDFGPVWEKKELPSTIWTRLGKRLGDPFPYRSAEAGLRPEDSIYQHDRPHEWRAEIMPEVHAFLIFEQGISPDEHNAIDAWWKALDPKPVPTNGASVAGCPVPATWETYER
jgi:hypothetical protein